MISNSDKKTEKSLCTYLAALKSQSPPAYSCLVSMMFTLPQTVTSRHRSLVQNEISELFY